MNKGTSSIHSRMLVGGQRGTLLLIIIDNIELYFQKTGRFILIRFNFGSCPCSKNPLDIGRYRYEVCCYNFIVKII